MSDSTAKKEDLGRQWRSFLANLGRATPADGERLASIFEKAHSELADPTLLVAAAQVRALSASRKIPAINFMGTMGCGKSSIAAVIAQRFGYEFTDSDHMHSEEARRKMASNIPLEDTDRIIFLKGVRDFFKARGKQGAICTCSALKEKMRFILRGDDPQILLDPSRPCGRNIEALDAGIVFVHVVKPYERALTELDRSTKVESFARKFAGQRHFINVTRENPLILQKQYEILENPKPWAAIILATEDFYNSATDRYDEKGMEQFLLKALGLGRPQ